MTKQQQQAARERRQRHLDRIRLPGWITDHIHELERLLRLARCPHCHSVEQYVNCAGFCADRARALGGSK